MQWPGKVKAGSSSTLVSATIDMMPTFCELLQVNTPAGVHGVSILPEIVGNEKQQKQHDYLYFEYPEYGGQQAVRMGNWKAVRMNLMKGRIVTELYDLSVDIKEQENVAARHPAIVAKMEAIMKKKHQTPQVSRFIIPVLER